MTDNQQLPAFSLNKFSRKIPYSFAKNNKICVLTIDDDFVHLAAAKIVTPLVISEIKRKINQPVKLHKVDNKFFDSIIAEAYSSANAAAVVDDMQEDVDLSSLMQTLQRT